MKLFSLRAFVAEDAAWLVDQHADHYTRVEGFDATFGPLVASIVADFLDNQDPQFQAGWVAQNGNDRLGSIFCVKNDGRTAKLRLFYLVEKARGTGAAQALLTECLGFARNAGYKKMTLWTHQSHAAAGRIYTRNGFVRTKSKPVHSFGVDLIEETWDIDL